MQLPSEQQVASFHQGNRDTYKMTGLEFKQVHLETLIYQFLHFMQR